MPPQPQKFTLTFNKGDGTVYKTLEVESGKEITIPAGPNKSGYTFSHWSIGGDSTQYKPGQGYTPTSDVTFTPNWTKNNSGSGNNGGSTISSYTIMASASTGGSISPSGNVSVSKGNDKKFTITANSGYAIADVLVDGKSVGDVSSYTFENVISSHTISVSFEKTGTTSIIADPTVTGVAGWLNVSEHMRYLNGCSADIFGPDRNMSRAEAAQMFYNLLLNQDVEVTTNFTDVPADAWYAKAISTLASLGIIKGVTETTCEPTRSITRAEFTVIAMRFAVLPTDGTNPFSDVPSNAWYYKYVVGSSKYGWIGGYTDGTFRPNATITRAEATAIANRMLGRVADKEFISNYAADLKQFTDVSKTYWAYEDIMEATNAHTYSKTSGIENWTSLN